MVGIRQRYAPSQVHPNIGRDQLRYVVCRTLIDCSISRMDWPPPAWRFMMSVSVTAALNHGHTVKIPRFVFIGYNNAKYQVAVETNGTLNWTAPR